MGRFFKCISLASVDRVDVAFVSRVLCCKMQGVMASKVLTLFALHICFAKIAKSLIVY
jgi:hypothetical protein